MTSEAVQHAIVRASYVAAFRADLSGPKSCGQDMLCVCVYLGTWVHTHVHTHQLRATYSAQSQGYRDEESYCCFQRAQ